MHQHQVKMCTSWWNQQEGLFSLHSHLPVWVVLCSQRLLCSGTVLLRCDAASMQMGRNIPKQEALEAEKKEADCNCSGVCVCEVNSEDFK